MGFSFFLDPKATFYFAVRLEAAVQIRETCKARDDYNCQKRGSSQPLHGKTNLSCIFHDNVQLFNSILAFSAYTLA